MKVLICGSRDWTDVRSIEECIDELKDQYGYNLVIIQGAARGADSLARDIALERNLIVESYPANWNQYGKVAGFMRNNEMLEQKPDLVIAFQKNNSRGTQHTIDSAIKRDIPVKVIHD